MKERRIKGVFEVSGLSTKKFKLPLTEMGGLITGRVSWGNVRRYCRYRNFEMPSKHSNGDIK